MATPTGGSQSDEEQLLCDVCLQPCGVVAPGEVTKTTEPVPLVYHTRHLFQQGAGLKCRQHPTEFLSIHCKTCNKAICTACGHLCHELCPLTSPLSQIRSVLSPVQRLVENNPALVAGTLSKLNKVHDAVLKEKAAAVSDIENTFCEIQMAMDAEKARLLREVESLTEKQLFEVEEQKKVIEGYQLTFSSSLNSLMQNLQDLDEEKAKQISDDLETAVHNMQQDTHSVSNNIELSLTGKETVLNDLKNMMVTKDQNVLMEVSTIDSGLNGPWGIVIGPAKKVLYLTENEGNSISVFNIDDRTKLNTLELSISNNAAVSPLPDSSNQPPCDSLLKHPSEITFDDRSHIIVADRHNHCVKRLNTDGEIVDSAGTKGSGDPHQLLYPTGLTFSSLSKKIYVTDTFNHRIQILDGDLKFCKTFGKFGSGNGQFVYPTSVCVDSTGRVYVVDNGNNRVQLFTSEGDYVSKFGSYGDAEGELARPIAIAVDEADNLYVSEWCNKRVSKFSSEGRFISFFGTGYLEDPCCLAICLDSEEKKRMHFVSEYHKNTLKIFSIDL